MIIYYDNENTLVDIVDQIESFNLFINGREKQISNNSFFFLKIKQKIEEVFSSSTLMPALGVSLHNETIKEMQKDIWIQINFKKELKKNDLPFDSLLVKLEDSQGFNLIRKHNGKYEGRCIYLHLDKEINFKKLFEN